MVAAVLPYWGLALLLLTTILLVQQVSRFAETLGSGAFSWWSALEMSVGLLPGVLIFTVPMSALLGVTVGISQMGRDSELVAMQSSGIGMWRCLIPMLIIGIGTSAATLFISLELVPASLRLIKTYAFQAVAYKLESPIELREFNLSFPGKVIYVRDGDQVGGEWGRIFINWNDGHDSGDRRLITARSGRIDSSAVGHAELVLRDAVVTTINQQASSANQQIVSEQAQTLRLKDTQLNDNRNAILERLENRQSEVDELGFSSLIEYVAETQHPKEKKKATFVLNRRLAMGVTPALFVVLGALVGMRNCRGGRGLGIILSITAMLVYYLTALAGEQFTKLGVIDPTSGAWASPVLTIIVIIILLLPVRVRNPMRRPHTGRERSINFEGDLKETSIVEVRQAASVFWGLFSRSMLKSLFKNFMLSFLSLLAIFYIFTLFELIRFIDTSGKNFKMIVEYLIYLLPFTWITLAPMGLLVAILVTYALIARGSESVVWWACGLSTYRLALPGLLFAIFIGAGVCVLQETILPKSNVRQEALRSRIKGGVTKNLSSAGRYWLAAPTTSTIYSYEYNGTDSSLHRPAIYEFDEEGVHLNRVSLGLQGMWVNSNKLQLTSAHVFDLSKNVQVARSERTLILDGSFTKEQFKPSFNTASQINSRELSERIKTLKQREDNNKLQVLEAALQRRFAEPFIPLMMSLVGVPLGLAFGKRSAITALAISVIIGVSFWGVNSGFLQLGYSGVLPPVVAGWVPVLIYTVAGVYLTFRAQT